MLPYLVDHTHMTTFLGSLASKSDPNGCRDDICNSHDCFSEPVLARTGAPRRG